MGAQQAKAKLIAGIDHRLVQRAIIVGELCMLVHYCCDEGVVHPAPGRLSQESFEDFVTIQPGNGAGDEDGLGQREVVPEH